MVPVRVSLRAGCALVFLCSVVIPCVLLILVHTSDDLSLGDAEYYASTLAGHERKMLDFDGKKDVGELQSQILELEQIRASVRNELRVMEEFRSRLAKEIESDRGRLSRLQSEVAKTKVELQDAHLKLFKADQDAKGADSHAPLARSAPIIVLPPKQHLPPLEQASPVPLSKGHYSTCIFSCCFNFVRCPLLQPFQVFVYNLHESYTHLFPIEHPNVVAEFGTVLDNTYSRSTDGKTACIFVIILDLPDTVSPDELKSRLQSLPYWKDDGANHLIIELSNHRHTASLLDNVPTGRAIVAKSWLTPNKQLRPNYDILISPILTLESPLMPPHVPAFRQNLIYFQGKFSWQVDSGEASCVSEEDLTLVRNALLDQGGEQVVIDTDCGGEEGVVEGEWELCATPAKRYHLCSLSTFALVVGGCAGTSGKTTYLRLAEALACGAIPVIIGLDSLPYDTVVDWHKAAIILPPSRFSEIHLLIRSLNENAILAFRRQGRFLWDMYFRSPLRILQSTVAIVRSQALHLPPVSPEYTGQKIITRRGDRVQIPYLSFQNNASVYTYEFWNNPPGPFFIYPVTPFEPGPVSGTQYVDSDISRLPTHIVKAGGITGPYFEHYLLGNRPEEQFTVVMLTYKRNDLLMQALERLRDISYLAKVVVVWNSPEGPSNDIEWPDIGVTVEVSAVEEQPTVLCCIGSIFGVDIFFVNGYASIWISRCCMPFEPWLLVTGYILVPCNGNYVLIQQ